MSIFNPLIQRVIHSGVKMSNVTNSPDNSAIVAKLTPNNFQL